MSTEERPGPLFDLTGLPAEMSPHEDQLLSLSIEGLDVYPIGDALFLSHRLCAILSDYSHLPSTESEKKKEKTSHRPTFKPAHLRRK